LIENDSKKWAIDRGRNHTNSQLSLANVNQQVFLTFLHAKRKQNKSIDKCDDDEHRLSRVPFLNANEFSLMSSQFPCEVENRKKKRKQDEKKNYAREEKMRKKNILTRINLDFGVLQA
jgi:hypothetical protein